MIIIGVFSIEARCFCIHSSSGISTHFSVFHLNIVSTLYRSNYPWFLIPFASNANIIHRQLHHWFKTAITSLQGWKTSINKLDSHFRQTRRNHANIGSLCYWPLFIIFLNGVIRDLFAVLINWKYFITLVFTGICPIKNLLLNLHRISS